MDFPLAKSINYFKTSHSSPDHWIDKAKRVIENFGGRIIQEAFGYDAINDKRAFLLVFEIGNDTFKVQWPVLPVDKKEDELAARRQAATLIYHDVKAKMFERRIKKAPPVKAGPLG